MIKLLKSLEGVISHPVTDDVVNRLKGMSFTCLIRVYVCLHVFSYVRVKSVLSAIATQLPCAAYSAFHTYRYYFAILALTFLIYLKHTVIFDVHIKYLTRMCSYHTNTLSTSTRTHR